MNVDDKTIIKYFDIIVKELEDISFFSVNNILIDNGYLKVKSQQERDFFFQLTEKVTTFGISRGYFQKNGDNGWLKLTPKGIQLKDSKKGLNKYIKDTNRKSESFYDSIILLFKNNRIIAIIMVLSAFLISALAIFNESTKAKENIEKWNSNSDDNKNQEVNLKGTIEADEEIDGNHSGQKILDTLKLKYLENVPILDKGIFLRYNYNDLQIGGANIDSLKINARSYYGNLLTISKYEGKLELPITKQPYIEFEYKENNYSIEVLGQHYSFVCILKKDIVPTLNLIEINK